MSFENLDKKILELIGQRSPAYDKQSWQKMEKLLDKYLPQKKNKWRGLWIFLFSLLLLGGGAAFLLIENFSQDKKAAIINKKINTEDQKNNQPENSTNPTDKLNKDTEQSNLTESISVIQQKPEKSFPTESLNNPTFSKTRSNPVTGESGKTQQSVTDREKVNTLNRKAEVENENIVQPAKNLTNENVQTETVKTINVTNDAEKSFAEIKTSDKKENETIIPRQESKKALSKNKKSILSNIIFSISAGPDVSKAGQSETGKVQLSYGAGLGYRISNRFSIHSGFYAGRKIYTAAPEDYNPPTNFWTYYPNLKHIDAECNVFEVPFNIYYGFKNSKKDNWFVSAGLSSIFMKKEEYNYYYKPINSPQYVYYSRTYENKNKHYFSILNLSGGYGRKLSSTVSVKAEPYAKIALTGIGYGKVKLNSGGILFSALIQPFNSVNKKKKNN